MAGKPDDDALIAGFRPFARGYGGGEEGCRAFAARRRDRQAIEASIRGGGDS